MHPAWKFGSSQGINNSFSFSTIYNFLDCSDAFFTARHCYDHYFSEIIDYFMSMIINRLKRALVMIPFLHHSISTTIDDWYSELTLVVYELL